MTDEDDGITRDVIEVEEIVKFIKDYKGGDTMEEIKNIHNCKYDLKGNLFFETNGKKYTMTAKEALEIAYTLFDSVGHSYDELDEI